VIVVERRKTGCFDFSCLVYTPDPWST